MLEKLLRDEIKAHTRTNVVLQKKFGDRLLEALRKYHNRAIETAQVIEELLKMAGDFKDALSRNEELGLNPDEIAFYDALAERPEVLKTMGDATLKQLATELPERPEFQRQWLFDLTWYEGSDRGALAVPLVLESEWLHDYERLREDFEKLLVAKAKTKVFVFEAPTSEIDEFLSRLTQAISIFRGGSQGEAYLLFCLDLNSSPYRFVHRVISSPP